MSSILLYPYISSWLNWWHSQKSPKYRAFLLPKSRKIYFDFHRWHWAVLAMCKDLNSQKSRSSPLQRSKYRQISILSVKNSIQSFGLGFSSFHEMWKHWNRVLFCFSENQLIVNLSAICEPFLTASVTVREAAPPRAIEAAVNDLWACEWSISLGCTILFFSEALQYYHEGFLMLFR